MKPRIILKSRRLTNRNRRYFYLISVNNSFHVISLLWAMNFSHCYEIRTALEIWDCYESNRSPLDQDYTTMKTVYRGTTQSNLHVQSTLHQWFPTMCICDLITACICVVSISLKYNYRIVYFYIFCCGSHLVIPDSSHLPFQGLWVPCWKPVH